MDAARERDTGMKGFRKIVIRAQWLWDSSGFFFLRRSALFRADTRNNTSRCLFRPLSRPQDVGAPYNSTGARPVYLSFGWSPL
jgi:hypothetical protein